ETLAAQVFPGQDPLGQRLRLGIGTDESDPRIFEIVGVVGDVRASIPAPPEIYVPHPQQSWSGMSLVVRTSGDPVSLAGVLRRERYGSGHIHGGGGGAGHGGAAGQLPACPARRAPGPGGRPSRGVTRRRTGSRAVEKLRP